MRPLIAIDRDRRPRVRGQRPELGRLRGRTKDKLITGPVKPDRDDPGTTIHPGVGQPRRVSRPQQCLRNRIIEQFETALLCRLSPSLDDWISDVRSGGVTGPPSACTGSPGRALRPLPGMDPWLPSRMIARRLPRKRRQKVSMRRINPIEWASGCSHPRQLRPVQDRVQLLTGSRKTLGAAEDPARPPTPRATQHSERHGNGNAQAVLQHLHLASTRAVATAGIVTGRDGNARSPSSLSPNICLLQPR